MSRRPLSKAQADRRSEASRAVGNIKHRQAIKSKLSPTIITWAHPSSLCGPAVKIVDAETRALIAAWEARRS